MRGLAGQVDAIVDRAKAQLAAGPNCARSCRSGRRRCARGSRAASHSWKRGSRPRQSGAVAADLVAPGPAAHIIPACVRTPEAVAIRIGQAEFALGAVEDSSIRQAGTRPPSLRIAAIHVVVVEVEQHAWLCGSTGGLLVSIGCAARPRQPGPARLALRRVSVLHREASFRAGPPTRPRPLTCAIAVMWRGLLRGHAGGPVACARVRDSHGFIDGLCARGTTQTANPSRCGAFSDVALDPTRRRPAAGERRLHPPAEVRPAPSADRATVPAGAGRAARKERAQTSTGRQPGWETGDAWIDCGSITATATAGRCCLWPTSTCNAPCTTRHAAWHGAPALESEGHHQLRRAGRTHRASSRPISASGKRILDIDSAGGPCRAAIPRRRRDRRERLDDLGARRFRLPQRLRAAAGGGRHAAWWRDRHPPRMIRVGSAATSRRDSARNCARSATAAQDYLETLHAEVYDLMTTVPNRTLRACSAARTGALPRLSGANAVGDDLNRLRLTRRCGNDFVRRRDAFRRVYRQRQRVRQPATRPRRTWSTPTPARPILVRSAASRIPAMPGTTARWRNSTAAILDIPQLACGPEAGPRRVNGGRPAQDGAALRFQASLAGVQRRPGR